MTDTDGGARLSISELELYEASGYTDNNDKLNQSFQLEVENNCKRLELKLAKVGSPTGDLTLELRGTSATGTLLATSATVAESSLTTAYSAIEFVFSSPPTLSASTTYWAILKTDRTASELNYVTWAGETSETYSSGKMQSENSSTWSDENKDALFEIFGEGERTFWQATTSTSTYTTTSTSPVEISDMTHTIVTDGNPVVIELISGTVGSTGTSDTLHSVGVNIDGNYKDIVLARSTNTNTDNDYPATFSYTTILPAGSHTITLAYKMVYGSNTVLSFMNSAIFSVRLT
jgi:hypothetical protein